MAPIPKSALKTQNYQMRPIRIASQFPVTAEFDRVCLLSNISIFMKEPTVKHVLSGQQPNIPIIINKTLDMFNEDADEWRQAAELDSYSFDHFYGKDESPIRQHTGLIELSEDHMHLQREPSLMVPRLETFPSDYCPRQNEDVFFNDDQESRFSSNHEPSCQQTNLTPNPESSEPETPNNIKKVKKIKKCTNPSKNQYDKNIFANINAVILKKLVAEDSREQVKLYCKHQKVNVKDFLSHFTQLDNKKFRFGTTELFKFYDSVSIAEGWKKVFGMFSVRFLQGEYVRYMLREGKMQEKEKYLRCATKLMYIPSLRKEEYRIISCLVNKVVDI